MTEKLTHWRKQIDTRFLGAHNFEQNQEITVEIESEKLELIKTMEGKDEHVRLLRFKGAKKPMILNATNAKTIQRVTGTPYVEEWAGRKIILYVAKVRAFGEMVDAVRVKNQKAE